VCDLETSRMGAPYIYIYIYIYDISRLRVNENCKICINVRTPVEFVLQDAIIKFTI